MDVIDITVVKKHTIKERNKRVPYEQIRQALYSLPKEDALGIPFSDRVRAHSVATHLKKLEWTKGFKVVTRGTTVYIFSP